MTAQKRSNTHGRTECYNHVLRNAIDTFNVGECVHYISSFEWIVPFASDSLAFGICFVAFMQSASVYAKHTLVVHSSPILAQVMQTSRWFLCISPKQKLHVREISVLTKAITPNAHDMTHFFSLFINIFDMTHLFSVTIIWNGWNWFRSFVFLYSLPLF